MEGRVQGRVQGPVRARDSIRGVMDALRRVVRELRLTARDAERAAGISGAQLFVLQSLADESAASLNDLAERTLTDQSSVSVVVKRLVTRKLVSRAPSRVDARRVELGLTAAGRRLLARCPEPTQVRLLAALHRLTGRELEGLTRGVGALVREMGLGDTTARMLFDDEAPSRARTARGTARGMARGTARASRGRPAGVKA
jgi:DNA-binding MarR family transcriptional regulator